MAPILKKCTRTSLIIYCLHGQAINQTPNASNWHWTVLQLSAQQHSDVHRRSGTIPHQVAGLRRKFVPKSGIYSHGAGKILQFDWEAPRGGHNYTIFGLLRETRHYPAALAWL